MKSIRRTASLIALALASACGICVGAEAENDFPSIEFHGLIDTRLVSADAEQTWLDGDLGKTRYGDGDTSTQLQLAEASLIALPRFSWSTSGYLYIKADPNQVHAFDIIEAYLAYQPVSTQAYRFRAKLGAFYPPISLENTGIGWTSPYTLSYSAINTWVAEELRGLGAEASLIHNGELNDVSVVAALTSANDRAGTLLYRRGWALHDFKPGINDTLPLPPRPGTSTAVTERETPFLEIDNRAGYYAGMNWRYDKRYSLHILYFDNHADPASRENGEASWLTQFTTIGTELELEHGITLLAQYMVGDTLTDIGSQDIKIDYQAAYILATKPMGKHRFTLRGDWFETTQPYPGRSDMSESGWAVTAAYSYAVKPRQRVFFELLNIDSYRYAREYLGNAEDANDIQFQVGYRLFIG